MQSSPKSCVCLRVELRCLVLVIAGTVRFDHRETTGSRYRKMGRGYAADTGTLAALYNRLFHLIRELVEQDQ